jgi:PTH1 family peptidyl-tRNA hydrolase
LIAQVGDPFWRLRIGIGHPGDKSAVLNYVLGRPQPDDERLILDSIQTAVDIVPLLLTDGPQKAMNRLHTRNSTPAADNGPGAS